MKISASAVRSMAFGALVLGLAGCGTVTGVPGHGGGKRFAIEQELISASARLALRQIDLRPLAGRTVRMVFASIGDEGSGNQGGGRLTLDRLLQGSLTSGPTTYANPVGVGVASTQTRGSNAVIGGGLLTDGPTGYQSQAFINPRDVDFLSSLVAGNLIMAGAQIKGNPAQPVDLLVIVLVDVFGTIRDRTDYLVYNQERLRARTGLEIVAVRQSDGAVYLRSQRGAAEAEWAEDYVFWTGPANTRRSLRVLSDMIVPGLPEQVQPYPAIPPAGPRPRGHEDSVTIPERAAASRVPAGLEARPNLLPKPDTKPRTNPPFN